jgi:hypothetical protein
VVAKLRDRLAVNKQRSHRFDMERFNIKELNQVKGKEQFRAEVSSKFAALKDLDAEVDINSAWETIREKKKKHTPWFDKGCSKLDQRKEAKLHWVQNQSVINGDNLHNARCEASRYFRNKKREYLKHRINELATNSKNKNIRDLYI